MTEPTDNQDIEQAELAIRGRLYQTVTVELSDGRKAVYYGQPNLDGGEHVSGVTVSPPKNLPSNVFWDHWPSMENP